MHTIGYKEEGLPLSEGEMDNFNGIRNNSANRTYDIGASN